MKRHHLALAASVPARDVGGPLAGIPNQTHTGLEKDPRGPAPSSEGPFVPTTVSARMHTLILTGELDRHSAHALEAEIELLCEEGVTGITLDLRQLIYIDSIGVAVIAFRCGLCQRRGYEFALIPGSRVVQRAFAQAGVAELLPFQEDELSAARRPTLVVSPSSREGGELRPGAQA
jgi:anti-anti-sigma factor